MISGDSLLHHQSRHHLDAITRRVYACLIDPRVALSTGRREVTIALPARSTASPRTEVKPKLEEIGRLPCRKLSVFRARASTIFGGGRLRHHVRLQWGDLTRHCVAEDYEITGQVALFDLCIVLAICSPQAYRERPAGSLVRHLTSCSYESRPWHCVTFDRALHASISWAPIHP